MFERFRRSRGTDEGATSLATRERDTTMDGTTTDRDLDPASERVDTQRFERVSPGERDRGVVAGGGEADLAADRPFERDEMSRGATGDGDGDTALDRDRARADLDGGDMADRDRMHDDDMVRGDMADRDRMHDDDTVRGDMADRDRMHDDDMDRND